MNEPSSETAEKDPWWTPEYVPEGKPPEELTEEEQRLIFGNGRKEFNLIFTRHELQALVGEGPIEDQVEKYRTLREARILIEKSQGDEHTLRIVMHSRILGDPRSYFEHWMQDSDGPEWVLEQIRELFGDDDSGDGGSEPEPPYPTGGPGDTVPAEWSTGGTVLR